MRFFCNKDNLSADIEEILRAFGGEMLDKDDGKSVEVEIEFIGENQAEILLKYSDEKNNVRNTYENRVNLEDNIDPLKLKSEAKRAAKIMLYDLLSALSGKSLPYGSLTGVRPSKLYHDLTKKGEDAFELFTKEYRVSEEKAKLIRQICREQEGLKSEDPLSADIFVNIPFCTSRCSYCSFISAEIGRVKKFVPAYVELLEREIKNALEIVRRRGFKLRAVYFGGGTPTALDKGSLFRLLAPFKGIEAEFTVEAGRPDSIEKDKLDVMDEMGVTRISVNPQSLNDKTVKLIGRKHCAADFFAAFELARKYPFDINCDVIAGLPGESAEDFRRTAEGVFSLLPENVTVHTLALKKGSGLKVSGYDNSGGETGEMVDLARELARKNGYKPYYMYRQKYMSGNLENTGYALAGKACIYNIDIMEECANIIACGAGGISKLWIPGENRLERLADPKGLDVYLARGDELLKAKESFFGL